MAILEFDPGVLEQMLGLPEGVKIVNIRMKTVGFDYAPSSSPLGVEVVVDGPGLPRTREGFQLKRMWAGALYVLDLETGRYSFKGFGG
jgi:hypothetical protein